MDKSRIRHAIRNHYDIQGVRLASEQRLVPREGKTPDIHLDAKAVEWQERMTVGLEALEKKAKSEVNRILKADAAALYKWCRSVKGLGPLGAGVMIAEFDIHRAAYPSSFWRFAGLDVGGDGRSPHPVAGRKNTYNKWLRSKLIAVIGAGLIKARNEKYTKVYRDYKHRLMTRLGPCMLCHGKGTASAPKEIGGKKQADGGKAKKCWNCVGYKATDGYRIEPAADGKKAKKVALKVARPYPSDRAPWGKGDAHRHAAALRYMVKVLVVDFFNAWREVEGLPYVPSYFEAKHGRSHREAAEA